MREYQAGRSLRELAKITGRSHGAVRNILERAGLRRRGRGAAPLRDSAEARRR
ncbi:helix-turn-helix domain-containing protein [Serinicoccus hydrothermalis]|uniref:helix-turn-helix domain-containing protein n=1 Tax=Serinicoccus hydrothermalis TaxID=1758689 RepID=UPI003AAEA96E